MILVTVLPALVIGVIAGLRSFTAPAVVSWATKLGLVSLSGTPLAFFGSSAVAWILGVLALGELIGDKWPRTPSRKTAGPFIGRIVMGALSGAALGLHAHRPLIAGFAMGALGAVLGTLGGYEVRARMVRSFGLPDFVVAICEDIIAVGGGIFLVTRI